jgi:hypothetical protein
MPLKKKIEGKARKLELIDYSIGVCLPYYANIGGPSGNLEEPFMAKGGTWSRRPVQVLTSLDHVLIDQIVILSVSL